MKMYGHSALSVFTAVAIAAAFPVFAQEEEETETVSAEAAESTSLEEELEIPEVKEPLTFHELPFCSKIEGKVQVQKPRSDKWEDVVVGKRYPLGSVIRTGRDPSILDPIKGKKAIVASSARLELGRGIYATVCDNSEFQLRFEKIGVHTRTVLLRRGRIELAMPRTIKDGEFTVAAPHFTCKNIGGDSWFEYEKTGDGDEAVVHVTTGRMSIEGRHYDIAAMRAADQLRIRTTGDDTFTCLTGEQGGFMVKIDQGIIRETDPLTKAHTDKPAYLNSDLTPKCEIKFWRGRASVGGRVVVSTMVIDAQGAIKSRRAFAEQRYNVNSGELVIKPKSEAQTVDKNKEEAEETETEQVEDTEIPQDDKEEKSAESAPAAKAESSEDSFDF